MKHEAGPVCPRCSDKLTQAMPQMVEWFTWLKTIFPEAHIAWSFRDEASQNDAFDRGLSKLRWPESKHNTFDIAGNPSSKALDLFALAESGAALFEAPWYTKINDENVKNNLSIRWGGNFTHFKDLDHFEMIEGH